MIACMQSPQELTPTANFETGRSLHLRGFWERAESHYLACLEAKPDHGEALHLLGLLHADTGREDTAMQLLRTAIAVEGPTEALCRNLGVLFERRQQFVPAQACYRQAIEASPDDHGLRRSLARMLVANGQVGEAEAQWRHLTCQPAAEAEDWLHLGNVLATQGRAAEAGEALLAVVQHPRVSPAQLVEAHYHLGIVHMRLNQPYEAAEAFRLALQGNPNHVQALNNYAIVLQALGQRADAADAYRKAIGLDPAFTLAQYNLGVVLQEMDQADEAIAQYRDYLEAKPEHDAAWTNLGNCFLAKNDFAGALACYEKTLQISPEEQAARWNAGIVQLLQGNLREGWKGYELRYDVKGATPRRAFTTPLWQGEPLAGKSILVHAEQGLGDTLQFCRYLPLLAEQGAKVVVEVQPQVMPLVATMPGVATIVAGVPTPPGGTAPVDHLPECDYQLPMLSLPARFDTTLENLPAKVPYLQAPPDAVATWAEYFAAFAGVRKIGVVWQGNPNHKNDRNRSMPAETLRWLANVPGAKFFSLQKGIPVPEGLPLEDLGTRLGDFSDTAGLVENLDLVISVDTAPAHLAGALGKPVWLLLPYAPDWRWLVDRTDSPWYPTARIFRQQYPKDWDGVLREVAAELSLSAGPAGAALENE